MMDALWFALGIAITLLASLSVVFYLRRPLRTLLADHCGWPERASFWAAFSNIHLVFVPVIFALGHPPGPDGPAARAVELGGQLREALMGLVLTVLLLGVVLSMFLPRARTAEADHPAEKSTPAVARM